MKEYLLQHLPSFLSSPSLLSQTCPIFHLISYTNTFTNCCAAPLGSMRPACLSHPRACSWLSRQLNKALLESLKKYKDSLEEQESAFSAGWVPVPKLQRRGRFCCKEARLSPKDNSRHLSEECLMTPLREEEACWCAARGENLPPWLFKQKQVVFRKTASIHMHDEFLASSQPLRGWHPSV